jgi:hypothetical protein
MSLYEDFIRSYYKDMPDAGAPSSETERRTKRTR